MMMQYQSTRNKDLEVNFKQAVSEGLSIEGGLFVPKSIPDLSAELPTWIDSNYAQMARRIFQVFAGPCLSEVELDRLIKVSLERFTHPDITPLITHGSKHILELFHGPTLSFKDVALQSLGHLFELWPLASGQRTILGATSGDTGSAAIAGLQNKKGVRAFILFPEGRVSPIQELQMTTVADPNIQCLAVEGDFDDCQNIVKTLFADREFREKVGLSAVNSINWSRITAQVTYYIHAYFQWLKRRNLNWGAALNFCVPTGNFGDIFAGYVAKKLGLPIGKLIIASNENDILTRFFETGIYEKRKVVETHSPAMDIQISSNFERLLFLLLERDDKKVNAIMNDLKEKGRFEIDAEVLTAFKREFLATRISNSESIEVMKNYDQQWHYILDPHTAIGVGAAEKILKADEEVVCLATAHPGKFQGPVEQALGHPYQLPEALAALTKLPKRKQVIEASVEKVKTILLDSL